MPFTIMFGSGLRDAAGHRRLDEEKVADRITSRRFRANGAVGAVPTKTRDIDDMRLIVAAHERRLATILSEALSSAGLRGTLSIDPLGRTIGFMALPPSAAEVVIMHGEELRLHRQRFATFAGWLHPRVRLLVVATGVPLSELLVLRRRIDGILFLEEGLRREHIDLGVAGYSCIPPARRNLVPNPSWRNRFKKLLSPEEQRVLGFLIDGLSDREIADVMAMPQSRTKTLVRAVLRKLGVQNRTAAALVAFHNQNGGSTSNDCILC